MTPELLNSSWLIAAVVVTCVLAIAGAGLARIGKNPRIQTILFSAAALALIAVLAQLAVGLLVARSSSINFNDHRWVLLSPWGRVGLSLGLGSALGIIILSWLGTRDLDRPRRRAAVVSCRIGAAICALVLFLQPAVELRQVAREPNRVAVLIDTSASMNLRDVQGGPTRLERAAKFIQRSEATIRAWKEKHAVELFTFDSDSSASADLEKVQASGQSTRIRHALSTVRARYGDSDLAGIILISDGLATDSFADGADDGSEIDFLRSLDANVHTVWAGKVGLRDVSVTRILADEFAFVRTVVGVNVILRGTGYGHRRIPVTLSTNGIPLRRKWVDLDADGSDTTLHFEFTPSHVGKFVYEVSTPVADDEAVADNNKRAFTLRVVRDKFRVLQVAGQPSWDVRALRGMLKQNPNVDLISFFILRTASDIVRAPPSELSLIPFPTKQLFREHLPSFDLIVLQNFNFGPYEMAAYLPDIKQYVEGGGSLIMLGGALAFSSGGYAGTPIADILPVTLAPGRSPALLDSSTFSVQLSDDGATHPVTSLRYDENENRQAWKRLPKLEGLNLVRGLKPGAITLATHPRLKTSTGKPAPVIAAGEAKKGRVLAVMTDSLWHWGFVAAADDVGDGRAYDKLWDHATRWLIRDPALQLLQLSSDRIQYEPNAKVALDVRLRGRDYKALADTPVTIRLSSGPSDQASTALLEEVVTTNRDGEARLELGELQPGVYRAQGESLVGGRPVSASDVFLVRAASAELDRSAADPALLRELSLRTGAVFMDSKDTLPEDFPLKEPKIVRVDRATDVELWSGPWLLVLIFGFLGLEWALRQRSGYR